MDKQNFEVSSASHSEIDRFDDSIFMNEIMLDLYGNMGNSDASVGCNNHSSSILNLNPEQGKRKRSRRKVRESNKHEAHKTLTTAAVVTTNKTVSLHLTENQMEANISGVSDFKGVAEFATSETFMPTLQIEADGSAGSECEGVALVAASESVGPTGGQQYPQMKNKRSVAALKHNLLERESERSYSKKSVLDLMSGESLKPCAEDSFRKRSAPSSIPPSHKEKRKKAPKIASLNIRSEAGDVAFSDCIYKILERVASDDSRPGFSTKEISRSMDDEVALAELSYLCKAKMYYGQHYNVESSETLVSQFSIDSAVPGLSDLVSPKKKRARTHPHNPQMFLLDVETDAVLSLVELLTKHVQSALGVHLMENAGKILQCQNLSNPSKCDEFEKWLSTGGLGNESLATLRMGLESASVIFFFACCKISNSNATCVSDDAVEASIALFRAHLNKTVIPAINQTGHFVEPTLQPSTESKASTSTRSKLKNHRSTTKIADELIPLDIGKAPNTDVKKGKSEIHPVMLQEMKKLYRLVHERTVGLLVLLFERLQVLVELVPLDDQQILLLTNGAMSTLEIDCSDGSLGFLFTGRDRQASFAVKESKTLASHSLQLQLSAISLVTCIFQRYPNHREVILEDVFPLMLKIPTQKRSLRSYTLRYSLCQAPSMIEELNAKLTLQPQPHAIQMMTALLLNMVQSCVFRPAYESDAKDQAQDTMTEAETVSEGGTSRLLSGTRFCWSVADSLVKQLLQRCSVGKGDTASEFRPFLVRFVEDLLTVWILPDYPAAELLLHAIVRRLNAEITSASRCKSNQQGNMSQETTYINLAFDILAKVTVVQARLLCLHRDKPISVISTSVDRRNEVNVANGVCKDEPDGNDLMISCDSCHSFVKCCTIGILNPDTIQDEWYCDSCRLGKVAMREQRKYEVSLIDDRYVFQHAFASCLTQISGTSEAENSIRLHLALWIDEVAKLGTMSDSKRKLISYLCRCFGAARPSGPFGETLSDEGYIRLLLARLCSSSSLLRSFRPQIAFFIKILSDEYGAANGTNGFRKLSLKVIERICEADPSLMTSGIVIKAVSSRLTDDSISVREAALSLVGSFVVHAPSVASAFHTSLLVCLGDVGISVRKRGVKIFQSILVSNFNYAGRSEVCDLLIKMAVNPKEEEVVRDLVHELFFHLWLTNVDEIVDEPSNATKSVNPEISLEPVKGFTSPAVFDESSEFHAHSKKRRRLRADVAAAQMISVVRIGSTGDHLYCLLSDLLLTDDSQPSDSTPSSPTHHSTVRRKSSVSAATLVASKRRSKLRLSEEHQQECVGLLVDALFEALVSLEERRSGNPTERDGRNLAAALQTIDVFAKLSPVRILPHVDTLLPYLKADSGVPIEDESIIVGAVCDVLFRLASAVPRANNPEQQRFSFIDRQDIGSAVANDLVQICYKFGTSALNSTVRVLVLLSNLHIHDNNNAYVKSLLLLGRTFYSYLYKKISIPDLSKSDFQVQSSVHRGLTVLGLVCQYHDNALSSEEWELEVDSRDPPLHPKKIDWLNLNFACYRLFSVYLQNCDPQTQCRAMQAFGGLFLAQPRLVLQLERIGLITDVMSENAALMLQLEALDCWMKILNSEEGRIDGGEAEAKMDAQGNITVSEKVSGDQDGDATLFGGVLTNHTCRLFEMLHSKQAVLRYSSLQLVSILLRQGLVNPNEAVPHLFALQGDIDNLPIRDLALTLLMVEGERRPDILRQRICAGVKLAYDMQRKLYNGKRKVSALITVKRPGRQNPDVECVFSSIFRECIMHNRKLRHGLYKNLLGLFELGDNSNDESITASGRQLFLGAKVNHQPKDLDLLSFVSQVLAHLPFNTVNDPLFIIYHISSIITLQGQQCIERFSSFLRPFGLTGDDDLDDTNMSEDTLERAASSKFPSRSHGASVLNSKDFDLLEFSNLCHESASLCLLLRLKSYLCTCYQLSLTRCLEYDPLAKERLCDRGALRVTVSNPFDASITETLLHTSQDSNRKLDKDALVRQYAEFRCRMREEHCLVPDDATCDKSEGEDFAEVEETIPDTFGGGFEPDASDEKSDLNVSGRRSSSRMVKESKQSNNRKRRSKS